MANENGDPNILLSLEESFKKNLIANTPSELEITVPDIPSSKEIDQKIDSYNERKEAARAVVATYNQSEIARIKRQPRLLSWVVGLTFFQLIAFNLIIAVAGWLAFKNGNEAVINLFLEILKYYIGATVLELVGMIWFVTKATFSSDHIKSIDSIVNKEHV